MSVYRKDSSGKLVKIAGSLTQRWNMLILPTKHSKLSAINDEGKSFDYDCYEITEAAEPYITKLTEMTTYSLFLEDANETPIVIVKYKNQSLWVYGNTEISIGQLQGKIDLYTTGFCDFNIGNLVLNGTMPLSVDNALLHESANPVMNSVLYDELEKITLSPGTNMTISDNNVIDTIDSPIFKKVVSESTRNSVDLNKYNDGVSVKVANDQWKSIKFDNITSLNGSNVWYTENNVYYSYLTNHYKLVDGQWQPVVFNGLASFNGYNIWRHNGNTYYSAGNNQYVLDETTLTWSQKLWVGLDVFNGSNVWQTKNGIYYSSGTTQYVLNPDNDTWTEKVWTGLTSFNGSYIWTDHVDYYYSASSGNQYKLDEQTSNWTPVSWNIASSFYGSNVWYFNGDIYLSHENQQYQFDTVNKIWLDKLWLGLTEFDGASTYTDGTNTYYGYNENQYVLNEATGEFKVTADRLTFNGQDITSVDTSNFVQKNTVADLQGVQQDTTNDTVKLEFNNTTLSDDYTGTFVLLNQNKTKSNNLTQISHFKHNTDISKQRLFSALSTQTGDDTVTYLIGFGAQTDGKGVFGSTYRAAGWFAEVFGKNLNTAKVLELDTEGLWLDNKEISPNTVRYDQEQSLTDAQKTQARNNLGLNDTGVAWGNITGTLSDQTDLQNQLNNKMSTENPTGSGSFSLNRRAGTTVGANSFAEGWNTAASNQYAHAEGWNTTASGRSAHAEGEGSLAIGLVSHAEGSATASGFMSHAEGSNTIAQRRFQHTFGAFNIADTEGTTTTNGKYIEIVGNGTAVNKRSNARTLDWSGNEWLAGNLQAAGLTDGETTQTMTEILTKSPMLFQHTVDIYGKETADGDIKATCVMSVISSDSTPITTATQLEEITYSQYSPAVGREFASSAKQLIVMAQIGGGRLTVSYINDIYRVSSFTFANVEIGSDDVRVLKS